MGFTIDASDDAKQDRVDLRLHDGTSDLRVALTYTEASRLCAAVSFALSGPLRSSVSEPVLFTGGHITPAFTSSGIDPQLILKMPPSLRMSTAREPDISNVYERFEGLRGEPADRCVVSVSHAARFGGVTEEVLLEWLKDDLLTDYALAPRADIRVDLVELDHVLKSEAARSSDKLSGRVSLLSNVSRALSTETAERDRLRRRREGRSRAMGKVIADMTREYPDD